jgi:hypothetical protein
MPVQFGCQGHQSRGCDHQRNPGGHDLVRPINHFSTNLGSLVPVTVSYRQNDFLLLTAHPEPIRLAAIEALYDGGAKRRAEATSMNVAGFVNMTDEELIVHAMRKAQSLLAEHIERGPSDAEEALTQLLEILDRQDVVAATDRLCREYGLRPLK